MFPALEKKYTKERTGILEAQRRAHEIAFAPVTFQVSRLMVKFGIFRLLDETKNGLTFDEVVAGFSYGTNGLICQWAVCALQDRLVAAHRSAYVGQYGF